MNKNSDNNSNTVEKEAANWKSELISWVQVIVAAALIALFLNSCIIANSQVPTSSMENTIMAHDRVIGSRLSYTFSQPERGDVVIFHYPDDPTGKTYYVKRIIGLPGETVQIDAEGKIYINGEVLEENYGLETIRNAGRAAEPITLGDDEYFVLGDNRNNSKDSRSDAVGNVKRSSITGRAWLRIWPLSDIGFLKHQ